MGDARAWGERDAAAHTDDQLDRLATALHTLGEPGGGGPA
jgi:hypothetical protein